VDSLIAGPGKLSSSLNDILNKKDKRNKEKYTPNKYTERQR
jgi:hypothetical protein